MGFPISRGRNGGWRGWIQVSPWPSALSERTLARYSAMQLSVYMMTTWIRVVVKARLPREAQVRLLSRSSAKANTAVDGMGLYWHIFSRGWTQDDDLTVADTSQRSLMSLMGSIQWGSILQTPREPTNESWKEKHICATYARHIIMDSRCPHGVFVNAGIPVSSYLGTEHKLQFTRGVTMLH